MVEWATADSNFAGPYQGGHFFLISTLLFCIKTIKHHQLTKAVSYTHFWGFVKINVSEKRHDVIVLDFWMRFCGKPVFQLACNCFSYCKLIFIPYLLLGCALMSQIFRALAWEERAQSPESGNIFLFEIGQYLSGDLVEWTVNSLKMNHLISQEWQEIGLRYFVKYTLWCWAFQMRYIVSSWVLPETQNITFIFHNFSPKMNMLL